MKYEEEETKDQTMVLLILNIIIAIILGIAIILIWCVDHVYAQPQYRTSTGSWGSWTDLTLENNYQFATNTSTSWSSYIQIKDTTSFEANKTYNLYATFEVKLTQSGTREIFSAIDPYIYNGSTLTNVSDKCTVSGTRSDKTTSSPITATTHTYKGSINCVGLKNTGYYPYMTFRFYSTVAMPTAFQFKIDRWEYHVGSDSTDANNIMNNANQNTQQIIESYNEATQNIIQTNTDLANNLVETIENQNKVCNENMVYRLNMDNADITGKALLNDGTTTDNNRYYISDYVRLDSGSVVVVQSPVDIWNAAFCFYDENKTMLSCTNYNGRSEITTIAPTNTYYFRTSVTNLNTITVTGTYCYDYREKETEQMDDLLNYDHDYGNQPNTSNANTTHLNEETMVADLDGNLTNVDIDIDTDANSIIWEIINNLVTQNTMVFTMIITLLSIGVIKLVLSR